MWLSKRKRPARNGDEAESDTSRLSIGDQSICDRYPIDFSQLTAKVSTVSQKQGKTRQSDVPVDLRLGTNVQLTSARPWMSGKRTIGSLRVPISLDRLLPKCEGDLAVSSKKIGELKDWIQGKMVLEFGPKCLLITGPSGCGKSATLKVICNELGVEVIEFDGSEYELSTLGDIWERPNSKVFQDFVRNAELSSIEKVAKKYRLLLIEQLPSNFYRDPRLLRQALAEFAQSSRSMIVFVLSNVDSCWDISPMKLFSPETLKALQMQHFKFNAITTTMTAKALTRVARKMGVSVSSETITSISASSEGDLRRAINTLAFYSRSITTGSSATAMRSKSANSYSSAPCHFDLFHFIGKVMYSNRSTEPNGQWMRGERKLRVCLAPKFSKRFPPKDDLNWLVDSAAVSAPFLADYIFEHEPNFAPSITNFSALLLRLCDTDAASRHGNMEEVARLDKEFLEISIRATIYYNEGRKKTSGSRGFYPFNKPQFARRASNSSMYCYLDSSDLQGLRVGLSACYRCFELGHSRCIHLASLLGAKLPGRTADFPDDFQYDIDETEG